MRKHRLSQHRRARTGFVLTTHLLPPKPTIPTYASTTSPRRPGRFSMTTDFEEKVRKLIAESLEQFGDRIDEAIARLYKEHGEQLRNIERP